ncbi:hypothetical protein [Pyruvatibacter sp.]
MSLIAPTVRKLTNGVRRGLTTAEGNLRAYLARRIVPDAVGPYVVEYLNGAYRINRNNGGYTAQMAKGEFKASIGKTYRVTLPDLAATHAARASIYQGGASTGLWDDTEVFEFTATHELVTLSLAATASTTAEITFKPPQIHEV